MNDKLIELKDLIGSHTLTGVDFDTARMAEWEGSSSLVDCQIINFTLDGTTYTACEDPGDGYRSSMRYIRVSDKPTNNTFPPCSVIGRMRVPDQWEDGCEVLQLVDLTTAGVVLEVGTSNKEDYYPCWVAAFTPENMAVNQ